ncbi:MAG TPA: signal recognition particle-docking protein FtsY [Clostridiales bacterium]|nr:signal recognition particle-docking protein FtsY [Clostridiales bacterium]
MGFFKNLFNGLKKTKETLSKKLSMIFGKGELTDEFFEDLEAILIGSDMGVQTTQEIIDDVRQKCKKEKIKTQEDFSNILRQSILDILNQGTKAEENYPMALLIIGVNGVGKTTSIGKMANYYKSLKKDVMLVAGDTFRAAATDQLTEWANRAKVKIVKQGEGADSASVVFDGLTSAKAKGIDVVLIDTAGRLHVKENLMEELKKIDRVVDKTWSEVNYKKYIVLDATTGQNAVSQVKYFNDAVGIDGIILTKLDGTSKGGIVIPIVNELHVPVVFVGVGEGLDDLRPFDAKEFVEAIL